MGTIAQITRATVGRTYELPLSRGYVAHWTAVNAIRELIQNALDSESPFEYEFQVDGDQPHLQILRLYSRFTTLDPSTLLLGVTSKAERKDAIGSFGEGYKIALLVLTREEYAVNIWNGSYSWSPAFVHSPLFGQDILAIQERPLNDRHTGLTISIYGLPEGIVKAVRDSCLHMQQDVGEIKSTRFGDILLGRPGKLYVGSLFICDTEMRYGYNIKPENIQLERDRQTVSSWDLRYNTTRMWYETGEFDHIAKMIQEETNDIEYASWNAPEMLKDACYRIFRQQHPGAIIARSPEQAMKMIEKGLTKTVYVGGSMYSAVSDSRFYKAEQQTQHIEKSPAEELQAFYDKWHYNMHAKANEAFRTLIATAKKEGWKK